MCSTKYIATIFASTPGDSLNTVLMSVRRSDGELFAFRAAMYSNEEAEKIKKIFNYIEELRTCSCTRNSVCEKHSSLQKI